MSTYMEIKEVEVQISPEAEGDDRVLATAQHIVKSLATSENMTRDMLQILSKFDNRLSIMRPEEEKKKNSPNLEETLAEAQRLMSKWDTKTSTTMLFQTSSDEARHFLITVENLQHLMENLSVADISSAELVRAQRLMEASMGRLQKEFHKILLSNSEALDLGRARHSSSECGRSSSEDEDEEGSDEHRSNRPLTDRISETDMVPPAAVADLSAIARRMCSAGYGEECLRVFALVRRSVIEESLYNLGVERITPSEVHKMDWGKLDGKMQTWITAIKKAVRVLFTSERRLCDQVFDGFHHINDSAFVELAKDPTARLLAFADAVAGGRRSPEKLFRMLDIYETLADLMPDIETLYSSEPCRSLKSQAAGILLRLEDAVRGILIEFESAIQRENSKAPTLGGTIHPLTRYVMNYLSLLSEYRETLVKLTAGAPIELPVELPADANVDGPSAALCLRVGWIVLLLQRKLDGKSKFYKDVALSYLFLMNNLNYILQKVKGSELIYLLGDDFLRRNSGKVRQYASNYERVAWNKVLTCLGNEGVHVGGGLSQPAVKDRFKGFNSAMEDVMRSHAVWVIPDDRLREEVCGSIAEKLIPPYRSFVGTLVRHKSWPESGRRSDNDIKYTPEYLQSFLMDLFRATPSSVGLRRRSIQAGDSNR